MTRPKPDKSEIATAEKDMDLFHGFITRMENPDTVLRFESAGKGVKIYEELIRDTQVYSMLQARSLALQGCEWQVEPAGRMQQHKDEAAFVEKVLKATNYDRLTGSQMQAIITGFKPVEIMWDASEGQTWIKEFRPRRPSRFVFDMNENLRLLTLGNIVDGELVPERKFCTWSFGSFDYNPYGSGLGYQCFWPCFFKKNDIKFWLVFAEKFGAPTGIGKFPPGTDSAEQDKLLDAIDAIQQETGIVIPENQNIEYLEAKRSGTINTYKDLVDYMDHCIAKVIVGHVIASEPGVAGTVAMADIFKNLSSGLLKSDSDSLCECHNQTFVRWLIDYNFPSPASGVREYPKVWRRTQPEEDLKALAERDKIIVCDMGMGKRIPESYIESTYGIPLAKEGEATISPADKTSGPGVPPEFMECPHCHGSFSEAEPSAVDEISDQTGQAALPFMDAMIEPLKKLVMQAKSLEEIRDGLLDLYGQINPSDLGALMEQALTAAELLGQSEVKDGD